jgi:AcrR family transcriptional regulator
MRDIAQAAGVSLGNLYNHFPGKEAIILAVAVAESEELAPLLQRLAASDGERAQVLVFLQDFHALCRQPEWATLAVEVLAESARNPAVAEAFAANRRQLQATLAEALQQVARRERRRPCWPRHCRRRCCWMPSKAMPCAEGWAKPGHR